MGFLSSTSDGPYQPAHEGAGGMAMLSNVICEKPSQLPKVRDLFTVRQVQTEDVFRCFHELRSCFADLQTIAKFHSDAGVAGVAQRVLADGLMQVLECWPRPPDSMKPFFRVLYAQEESAFRARWNEFHDKTEKGKSRPRRGERKRLAGYPARKAFVDFLMHLTGQTGHHEMQCFPGDRTKASEFYKEHPARGNEVWSAMVIPYYESFGQGMRAFFQSLPDLESQLASDQSLRWDQTKLIIQNFDVYFKTVVQPYAKKAWPWFAKSHSEVPQPWSKNAGTSKSPGPIRNLLFRQLRSNLPEVP